MEKTNNLIQEWYKNSNEKIKTKYVPNVLPVTRENQVNKTTAAYYGNLPNYYSNELTKNNQKSNIKNQLNVAKWEEEEHTLE